MDLNIISKSKIKDSNRVLVEILKKSAGSWKDEDWEKIEKRRNKIEFKASKARKSFSI